MLDKLPPKILFVEHAKNNTSFLNTIERSGFDIIKSSVSDLKVEFINKIRPSLIIIDSVSSNASIDCVYQELVELINAPFIFLLDKDEIAFNNITTLNNLVSFLSKPFLVDQLMALIKSSLRRSKMVFYDKVIKYKHISMDLSTYMVYEKNNIARPK